MSGYPVEHRGYQTYAFSRPPTSSSGGSNPAELPPPHLAQPSSSHGYPKAATSTPRHTATPATSAAGLATPKSHVPAPLATGPPGTTSAAPPPQSPYSSGPDPGVPGSGSSQYNNQPITPLSGSHYSRQPPHSSGSATYFGMNAQTTPTDQPIPSPPPTSASRPNSAAEAVYTPDGTTMVPVGVSGGKMFRCRGYGDCDKVFTRSEHLARHVRKHTGERPFPCHCGKAFSRLDNLRQHAATVHADQGGLNEAMLNALGPVHAALSVRAGRDQRKRGEIVEVPKNAVERPRHNDGIRIKGSPGPSQLAPSPYVPYGHTGNEWAIPPPPQRPRTGAGYEYSYPPPGQPIEAGSMLPPSSNADDIGPSRRPASSGYHAYQPVYYDSNTGRPPTAPPITTAAHEASQFPYPYRPMSSSGRDLPVPAHYAESEASAHSGYQQPPSASPMYPPPHGQPQAQWASPHSAYPPQESYHQGPPPPPEAGYSYPPSQPPPPPSHTYGHPPNSTGTPYYPPQSPYYPPPQQQYGQVPPPPPQHTAPPSSYPPHTAPPPPGYHVHPPPSVLQTPTSHGPHQPPPGSGPGPQESPFSYHAPHEYSYGTPQSQWEAQRKRRADEESGAYGVRKQPRSSLTQTPSSQPPGPPPVSVPVQQNEDNSDSLWLPPTTERRSSLAISALLGSPQQVPKSRPETTEPSTGPSTQNGPQSDYNTSSTSGYSFPPTTSTATNESSEGGVPVTPRQYNEDVKPSGMALTSAPTMEQKA